MALLFYRYPFAFRQCGLLLTSSMVLLCFGACQMSMQLLLASSQLSGRRSLEDLAYHCFGRVGKSAVQTAVFLLNMGCEFNARHLSSLLVFNLQSLHDLTEIGCAPQPNATRPVPM